MEIDLDGRVLITDSVWAKLERNSRAVIAPAEEAPIIVLQGK